MQEEYLPLNPVEVEQAPIKGEPTRVVIGSTEFVVCPTCQGIGTTKKLLRAGEGGRKRAKVKEYTCKTCYGKRRMPAEFYERFLASQEQGAAQ